MFITSYEFMVTRTYEELLKNNIVNAYAQESRGNKVSWPHRNTHA